MHLLLPERMVIILDFIFYGGLENFEGKLVAINSHNTKMLKYTDLSDGNIYEICP